MSPRLRPSILLFPMFGMAVFFAITVLFFFFGPIDWPVRNPEQLSVFLAFLLLALVLGFITGATSRVQRGELTRWRAIYVMGGLSACAMLFPSAYIYTGKMPWQIFEALADQRRAYEELQERLVETDGSRGPVVLARSLTFWMTYAVIPLAVWHWQKLSWLLRLLAFGTLLATAAFSILRGTDREVIDLGILFGAALLVALARSCAQSGRTIGMTLMSRRSMIAIAVGAIAITLGFGAFVDRKSQRLGGQTNTICVGESGICANHNHPAMAALGQEQQFALAMITAYVSQGYYGLGLALDREFISTYGVGHSPALTRLYEAITGDVTLYESSFTYRIGADGWSDRYQWSTLYVWIANDVGFALTIPIVGFLAWLWGKAWISAVLADNDAGAIVFCMLAQAFIYAPANNQLTNVLDAYAALIVWLVLWICGGFFKRKQAAAMCIRFN